MNGERARKVGGGRRSKKKRKRDRPTEVSTTATMLLGLAAMAAMTSPIAAASLHSTPPPAKFRNRRQRRKDGERSMRRPIIDPETRPRTSTIVPLHPHEGSNEYLMSVRDVSSTSSSWVDCKLLTKFKNKAGRIMCTVEYRLREGELLAYQPDKPIKYAHTDIRLP